MYAHVVNNFD